MTRAVVFVDSAVEDLQGLIDALGANAEVIRLDATRDGVVQMAEALANRSGISAIHVISHGSRGALRLGTTTLSRENLRAYASQLGAIGRSLTSAGDLLLYGCDVAQGDEGQAFVSELSRFTGADIAASTDLTGAAALGGDWVLEANIGNIEAWALADSAGEYQYVLADGDLDTTFDNDGKVMTDIATSSDGASAVAVQSDGKIVLAGSTYSTSTNDYNIALVRYNTDGLLDPTFGAGGKVITTVGPGEDVGSAVAILADGRILVGGRSGSPPSQNFALLRYTSNGSLDTSFSDDGIVTTAVSATTDAAYTILVQPDGKILLAGYAASGSVGNIGLVRYNPDGLLDPAFGTGGIVITDFGSEDSASDLALQPDGKIIVSGYTTAGGNDLVVLRYNTDGSLDNSFDGDGKARSGYGGVEFGGVVALQADGKIVVAGDSYSSGEVLVLRFDQNGALDPTFDGDGRLTTAFNLGDGGDSTAWVAVQPDGKIVVAGSNLNSSGNYDFGALRLNTDGTPDTSFSGDGRFTTAIGAGNDAVSSGALLPNGNIVIAGYAGPGGNEEFAVIRLLGTPAPVSVALDPSFDGDGKVTTAIGSSNDKGTGVAVQPDGKIVVAGTTAAGGTFNLAVARYNANGTLDTSFDGDGTATTAISVRDEERFRVVQQPDGKILVGVSVWVGGTLDFGVVRYNADGLPDTGFGASGKVTTAIGSGDDRALGIALQPDGKIVAAGVVYSADGVNSDFGVVRYNTDGSLDSSFDADGRVLTQVGAPHKDFANGIVVLPDGKLLVAGSSYNGSNYDFALVRYNANGSLDTTFDDDGRLTTPIGASSEDYANAMARQPDGKILVAGHNVGDFALVRYSAEGVLDTSFDGDGKLTTPIGTGEDVAHGVAVQADGRILVSGYTHNGSNYDFAVARYNTDGSLDTSFDGDGKFTAAIGSGHDLSWDFALQPGGNIVLAGQSHNGSNYDFAAMRLSNPVTDLAPPLTTSVWVPVSGTYTTDNNLDFAVTFTEAVTVTGTPRLALNIGGQTRYANYVLGSGFSTLQFRHTVQAGDSDNNGIGLPGGIELNGGTINDAANNPAVLTLNGAQSTAAVLIAAASAAVLDPAFDGDGKVTTTFASGYERAQTVALQTDGKILVAGQAAVSGTHLAVVRYNTDGSLDATFDTDGKVTTPVLSVGGNAYAVVQQPDGRILAVGVSVGSAQEIALVRYNANGSLDATFDGDGKVTTVIRPTNDSGSDVALQLDGKIVVSGSSSNGGNFDAALVRYNANGSLDSSFDGDGKLTLDWGGIYDAYSGVAVQPDGRIVVAGSSSNGGAPGVVVLARYNANGILDTSFAGDGTTTTAIGTNDAAVDLVLQPDGKILAAGYSLTGATFDFALFRFNTDGTLDGTFDGDGKVSTAIGSGNDFGQSIALQSDGKILVSGYSSNGSNNDFAVVRYNTNGSLDTSFDGDGKFTFPIGSGDDVSYGNSLALQPNGDIVVAGSASNGANEDFAVARILNPVTDLTPPSINAMLVPAAATYNTGSPLGFTLGFSENVSVTGSPRVALDVGGQTRYATYSSGGGGASLNFGYTVQSGDVDTNGLTFVGSTLDLNGGTLADAAGNPATLTLPTPPSMAGVIVNPPQAPSDTTPPTVAGVVIPASGDYGSGAALDFRLNFSETVTVSGTPRIALDVGGQTKFANYVSGSNSSQIVLRYTVGATDSDTNGIAVLSVSVDLAGGTIKDLANNSATLSLGSVPNTAGVKVVTQAPGAADTTPPAVVGVAVPPSGSYAAGEPLVFAVSFNEAVTVTGAPRIALDIGGQARFANLETGNGTSVLGFRYVLVEGDVDLNGIGVAAAIDANGGTLKDAAGNNATLNLSNLPSTTGVAASALQAGQFNRVTGTAGNDNLAGTAGADLIDGLAGADAMAGGAGDDLYIVDNFGDTVTDTAGADQVRSSVSFTLPGGVESLTLTGTAGAGTGNSLDNEIIGNAASNDLFGEAGADTLTGNEGNDFLDGGAGNDTLRGGAGNDLFRTDSAADVVVEAQDEGIDTVVARSNFALGANVERLTFEVAGNFEALGNPLDNEIRIQVGGSRIRIDGGAGDDVAILPGLKASYTIERADAVTVRLIAGVEANTLLNVERVRFSDNTEFTLQRLLGSTVTEFADEFLSETDQQDTVDGGGGDDTLQTGGGDDTVDGGVGDDQLFGGDGDDDLDGGPGNDTLDGGAGEDDTALLPGTAEDYEFLIEGSSFYEFQVRRTGGETDTVANVERLRFEGGGELTLRELMTGVRGRYNRIEGTLDGTAGNDEITGTSANELLRGFGGNDLLNGATGADRMEGGAGNDVFFADQAADTVIELEGEGNDTVRTRQAVFSLRGTPQIENLVYMGSANFTGTGNASGNVLIGGALHDLLIGDAGSDWLVGGAGRDQLNGGLDNDVLEGGTGADRILGGAGEDTAVFSERREAYVFARVDANATEIRVTEIASGEVDTLLNIERVRFGDGVTLLTGPQELLRNTASPHNDIFEGTAEADTFDALAGNDTLRGQEGLDQLFGGPGNDSIEGGSGDDHLDGGPGNDRLDGGSGSDNMEGGPGNDAYAVDSEGDAVSEVNGSGADGVETLLETYLLPDRIENLKFTGEGNFNGSGNAAANEITGGGGNDTLVGLGGNDTLRGGEGNDLLDGGAGVDRMEGGAGDDTYVVDRTSTTSTQEDGSAFVVPGDALVELAGGGVDTVRTALGSFSLVTLGQVERLVYTGAAGFSGTGNALDNRIESGAQNDILSGGPGNDTLVAGEGNDRLAGGAGDDLFNPGGGNDSLDGGAGTDIAVLAANRADYVFSRPSLTTVRMVQRTSGETDLFTLIEQVRFADGSSGALTLSDLLANTASLFDDVFDGGAQGDIFDGLAGNDRISGGGGDDSLKGGTGNDALDGGTGADSLEGGTGDDSYVIDDAGDAATEAPTAGRDLVTTTLSSLTLWANVENLEYAGSGAFAGTGNDSPNTITGGAGNDSLVGGGGNDLLRGGEGNDTLDGGAGADRMSGGTGDDTYIVNVLANAETGAAGDVVAELLDQGTDTVFSSVSYVLGPNLENLTLIGETNIGASGNTLANRLLGNAGNNSLAGGEGNDTLDGSAGVDALEGGIGADRLLFEALDRLVSGGAGEDTAVLQGSGVTLDLTDRTGLRMRGIDTLDITGSGNNTFVVAALQVLEQQNLLNRMVILGNEGDLVRMSGTWTEGAATTLDGRSLRTFSSGSATLLVDSRVSVGS